MKSVASIAVSVLAVSANAKANVDALLVEKVLQRGFGRALHAQKSLRAQKSRFQPQVKDERKMRQLIKYASKSRVKRTHDNSTEFDFELAETFQIEDDCSISGTSNETYSLKNVTSLAFRSDASFTDAGLTVCPDNEQSSITNLVGDGCEILTNGCFTTGEYANDMVCTADATGNLTIQANFATERGWDLLSWNDCAAGPVGNSSCPLTEGDAGDCCSCYSTEWPSNYNYEGCCKDCQVCASDDGDYSDNCGDEPPPPPTCCTAGFEDLMQTLNSTEFNFDTFCSSLISLDTCLLGDVNATSTCGETWDGYESYMCTFEEILATWCTEDGFSFGSGEEYEQEEEVYDEACQIPEDIAISIASSEECQEYFTVAMSASDIQDVVDSYKVLCEVENRPCLQQFVDAEEAAVASSECQATLQDGQEAFKFAEVVCAYQSPLTTCLDFYAMIARETPSDHCTAAYSQFANSDSEEDLVCCTMEEAGCCLGEVNKLLEYENGSHGSGSSGSGFDGSGSSGSDDCPEPFSSPPQCVVDNCISQLQTAAESSSCEDFNAFTACAESNQCDIPEDVAAYISCKCSGFDGSDSSGSGFDGSDSSGWGFGGSGSSGSGFGGSGSSGSEGIQLNDGRSCLARQVRPRFAINPQRCPGIFATRYFVSQNFLVSKDGFNLRAFRNTTSTAMGVDFFKTNVMQVVESGKEYVVLVSFEVDSEDAQLGAEQQLNDEAGVGDLAELLGSNGMRLDSTGTLTQAPVSQKVESGLNHSVPSPAGPSPAGPSPAPSPAPSPSSGASVVAPAFVALASALALAIAL
jgi:hypothetical protein